MDSVLFVLNDRIVDFLVNCLQQLYHTISRNCTCLSDLSEDCAQFFLRQPLGSTNVVQDTLHALHYDLIISPLGSGDNFTLEAVRSFLSVTEVEEERVWSLETCAVRMKNSGNE